MGLPKKEFTDIIHLVAFEHGIWSGIEVVITGLTRKVAELITLQLSKARVFFDFLANASFFLNFG